MSQSQLYDAFGLTIKSDFPLHELRPAVSSARPDITIIDKPVGCDALEKVEGVMMDYEDPDGVVMAWREVAAFRFVDQSTIWAQKHDKAPPSYIAFPILGPVMAWMLNWRGYFVLHASAVEVNGKVIALMGDKMAGKSTTAAAFLRAGHKLVTDDLLALKFAPDGSVKCFPAFPQLKLEGSAAEKVKVSGSQELPLVFEGFTKHQHKLADMVTEPVSIDYLFRLDRGGEQPEYTQFDLPEAINAASRYSYLPRFSTAPWTDADRAKHFQNCVSLAKAARLGSLQIPHDLDRLDETIQFVASMIGESDQ